MREAVPCIGWRVGSDSIPSRPRLRANNRTRSRLQAEDSRSCQRPHRHRTVACGARFHWSGSPTIRPSGFRSPACGSGWCDRNPNFRGARHTSAMANGKQGRQEALTGSRRLFGDIFREWLCSAGLSGSQRILEPLCTCNCLPFNSVIISSACLFILSRKPISYCRFKRINVYIL